MEQQMMYLRQCTNLIFCKRGRSKDTEVSKLHMSSSKTCKKLKLISDQMLKVSFGQRWHRNAGNNNI